MTPGPRAIGPLPFGCLAKARLSAATPICTATFSLRIRMDSVAEVSTRIIPCEERKRTSWKLGGGEDVSKSRDNKQARERSNKGVRWQEKRIQGIPKEFKRYQENSRDTKKIQENSRIQRDISSGVAALKQILPPSG